jgi:hypothetical protein
VSSSFNSGPGGTPSLTLQFLSPTALVNITAANQSVFVVANRALGAYAAAAGDLDLWVCYGNDIGGGLVQVGGAIYDMAVSPNIRIPFNMNGIITNLPIGTYTVGMCGTSSSANWTNNEWGYVSALVYTKQ